MRKKKATVIALSNQKGGIGKTTTCLNLGAGLALAGKKVLEVDCDQQGSLTVSAGYSILQRSKQARQGVVQDTLADLMFQMIEGEPVEPQVAILHHQEGFDLIPANKDLAALEVSLVTAMCRETVLKRCLEDVQMDYDYILLDCPPSLFLMTTNALAFSDYVIIPTLAERLSIETIPELLTTVNQVKWNINPKLQLSGILPTIVDERTNFTKDILTIIHETYDKHLSVFPTSIPRGVKAAEATATGQSIFAYAPKSTVAKAYKELADQVLTQEKQRTKQIER